MLRIFAIGLIAVVAAFFRAGALEPEAPLPRGVKPVATKQVQNVFSLGGRIYSGSSPHDEAAFEELRTLGIKTIISVDGSKPEVELARKFGMRYIHLPVGYDGTREVNRLIKAAEVSEGPLYMHCHHGKHRGPAAAALVCQGLEGWSTNQALAWLTIAGTSPDYPGLWKESAKFRKPSPEEMAAVSSDFPEVATVSGLVDAMVVIDQQWENLKAIQKAGYAAPPDHPDLVPPKEAMLLRESYRELLRIPEVRKKGGDFLERLRQAEADAAAIHAFLSGSSRHEKSQGMMLWQNAANACRSCHEQYRN